MNFDGLRDGRQKERERMTKPKEEEEKKRTIVRERGENKSGATK